MGTTAQQDDPMLRLRYYRETGQDTEATQYEAYLRETGQWKDQAPAQSPAARPEMSRIGQIQGAAESAMDAASLGLSGLAGDFIASLGAPTFKELRAERRARRESVPSSVRVPLELAGAVATPVPGAGLLNLGKGYSLGGALIKQAPQTAKLGVRTARAAGDAALQSGIAGTAYGLDDLSGEGLMDAAGTGLLSAFMGAGIAGGLGSGTEMAVRGAKRIKGMKRLDKAAFAISDDIKRLDKKNYPLAEQTMVSTPQMRGILNKDEVVAPRVRDIRHEAAYQSRSMNDPKALMAAYRRLSSEQRRAQATLERAKAGDVQYDAKLSEGTIENIKKAKERLLAVSNPAFRRAVNVHRVKSGELDAMLEGADIGIAAARNKSVRGGKMLTESREAYLRKIPKMTTNEAELALAGILGRFPEQASLTSSPLGLFGLVTSAVRAPLTTYRTMPIIRALEEKLGRGSMGQKAGDLIRGTSARYLGGLLGR